MFAMLALDLTLMPPLICDNSGWLIRWIQVCKIWFSIEIMTNIDTFTKRLCISGYQAPNCFYRLWHTIFTDCDSLLQLAIQVHIVFTDSDTKLLIRSVSMSVCVNVRVSLYVFLHLLFEDFPNQETWKAMII